MKTYGKKYRKDNKDKKRAANVAWKRRKSHKKHTAEGALILGPYKLPLKNVEEGKGFGYYGALSFDTKSRLQCHICGDLHDELGLHLRLHNISADDYRSKFQLSFKTSLISERQREKRKVQMARLWSSMTEDQRRARKAKSEKGRRKWWKTYTYKKGELTSETKNKRGTCPDQLLELIKIAANSYGRTPSIVEFEEFHKTTRFKPIIVRTYGSWNRAVKAAGWKPNMGRINSPKGIAKKKYSKEELLDLLHGYYEEHGVTPSASDSRRGFLPSERVFTTRFGSFPEARRQAGLPNWDLSIKEEDKIKGLMKK